MIFIESFSHIVVTCLVGIPIEMRGETWSSVVRTRNTVFDTGLPKGKRVGKNLGDSNG